MPAIAFTRRGPAFPWHYAASGTSASWVYLWAAITIGYSLADPLAIVPPDDTIAPEVSARTIVDPATYAGGAPGSTTFDAYHEKWLLLTYAGSKQLYLMAQSHVDDLDTWLTQPDKTIPGTPPIFVPSPYGTTAKSYAILAEILGTHLIDKESGD